MRFKQAVTKLILTVLVLTFPGMAQAAYFDYVDYQTAGDGLILQDRTNGLDWLALSMTTGLSYSQIAGNTQFDGWRHATASELEALFVSNTSSHALTIGNNGDYRSLRFSNPLDVAVHNELREFFLTYTSSTERSGHGILEGTDSTKAVWAKIITYSGYNDLSFYTQYYKDDTYSLSFVGNYLVRETTATPIPGAVWLLGSGLIGLIGLRIKE